MTVYIGCDFHPYQQTVAWCDTSDGEIKTRTIFHADREALLRFYKQFQHHEKVVVGVEASGALSWFEKMITALGYELLVGDAARIRKAAPSRHKSDRRDAEHILDMLMTGRFPGIWRRPPESDDV